eukprot:10527331-Lingulodinium_polyedra.AAC.1
MRLRVFERGLPASLRRVGRRKAPSRGRLARSAVVFSAQPSTSCAAGCRPIVRGAASKFSRSPGSSSLPATAQ